MSELEVVWTQAMETAAAKAAARPPQAQLRERDSVEVVAFFVESHPDCSAKNIVVGTKLSHSTVNDALFRLKRSARVVSTNRGGPYDPMTWRVVGE
jgi:hypothetical protein